MDVNQAVANAFKSMEQFVLSTSIRQMNKKTVCENNNGTIADPDRTGQTPTIVPIKEAAVI